MKLENIGFYTLSDERAKNVSVSSPLQRCELVLTPRCNFKCPYCRGLRHDISSDISFEDAMNTVKLWCSQGLKNVRFSGGEPTLYRGLEELVAYCKNHGVEHIAISTNGSANLGKYISLLEAGVNDFSISLDACCAAVGDRMAGGITGAWNKVTKNISTLSFLAYTTVGIVITDDNISQCLDTIYLAGRLGVSDIRVIPAAQQDRLLTVLKTVSNNYVRGFPILKYRIDRVLQGKHVRGINPHDTHRCWLALDDMAVAGGYHFPCIIHMREQGDPIGKLSANVRNDRHKWVMSHDCHNDPICKNNCLDVCVDYNNKVESFKM